MAANYLNFLTFAWIILCIYLLGLGLGVQYFMYAVLLIDFFLPYWKLASKLIYTVLLCALRLVLFFWSGYQVTEKMSNQPEICYMQIITTVCLFLLLGICGCLISSNFLAMEEKLIETNKKLRRLAETDPLTKLMNRMCIIDYAQHNLKKRSGDAGMSVAIGDIDYFKKFNDTYGHECGDVVLTTLAELFMNFMQPYGAAARWGGEEFLFFFKKNNGDEAYDALLDLRRKIKALEIPYGEQRLKVNMTFGLTEINRMKPLDESILEADHKLYYGKEHGRDRVIY